VRFKREVGETRRATNMSIEQELRRLNAGLTDSAESLRLGPPPAGPGAAST